MIPGWIKGRREGGSTSMVFLTSSSTLAKSRASTAMAVASPPASLISLSTVLMVEWTELGFGGKCVEEEKASLVVLADKTTA